MENKENSFVVAEEVPVSDEITFVEKADEHLNSKFYEEVDEYVAETAYTQIMKGADKYPEPFNPDSWTCDELADHAMQENRDQAVYITGMRDRMRKQEAEIGALNEELDKFHGTSATALDSERMNVPAVMLSKLHAYLFQNYGIPYESDEKSVESIIKLVEDLMNEVDDKALKAEYAEKKLQKVQDILAEAAEVELT